MPVSRRQPTAANPRPEDAFCADDSPLLRNHPTKMLLRIFRQSGLGDPEGCAAVLSLISVGKLLRARMREVLTRYDLSELKLATLICLYAEEPASCTPADLARQVRVSRATMSTALEGMSRRGWLNRERGLTDRRTVNVHLTRVGRRLVEESVIPFLGAIAQCADTLAGDEWRTLSKTCAHLCVSLRLTREVC